MSAIGRNLQQRFAIGTCGIKQGIEVGKKCAAARGLPPQFGTKFCNRKSGHDQPFASPEVPGQRALQLRGGRKVNETIALVIGTARPGP